VIVDTYGTPTYKEANPAVISIASFPFFFGMMFGDMGHGSIICFFAIYLILFARSMKKNPSIKGILQVRYMLFIMGIMSTWAGLIYNEFFAIPTNIFGSCYKFNDPETIHQNKHAKTATFIWRRQESKCVYPFGQDPAWAAAENKLTLVNSIKMKMSVIFGVVHMVLGILIKGTNMIRQRKCIELLTEVVAGLVILLGLFGWMDALIIKKFFMTYDIDDCSTKINGRCIGAIKNEKTPGIISIMITTVFGFGNYDESRPQDPIFGETEGDMYTYSVLLLLSVVVCVPIMLCTKPLLFLMGQKKQRVDANAHIELVSID
jgi:V-type H+-transporting ATPase subunit a